MTCNIEDKFFFETCPDLPIPVYPTKDKITEKEMGFYWSENKFEIVSNPSLPDAPNWPTSAFETRLHLTERS